MQLKNLKTKAGLGIAGLSTAAVVAAYFMAPIEGEKFKAYPDSGGVPTICHGHTKGVKLGMIATQEQCDRWYAEDIAVAEAIYDTLVYNASVPDNAKAASISFIFNLGGKNFERSTLRKKLNAGNIKGACNEFPKWKLVQGKNCEIAANNCAGIITRRAKERELCLDKNVYDAYRLGADGYFVGIRNAQN